MSLMDVIKKHSSKSPPSSGATSAGDIQGLMNVKQTGKLQAGGASPKASNLQAQAAQSQVRDTQRGLTSQQRMATSGLLQDAALAQEDQDIKRDTLTQGRDQAFQDLAVRQEVADTKREAQGEMAGAQLQSQETQFTREITNKYANTLADLASQRGIVEQDIFQDFNNQVALLGRDKAMARLEQIGHTLAMSDQRYVDELRRVGALQDLTNEMSFKQEALRLAFQKDMDILGQYFDMQRIMNQDMREAKRELAQMDINAALDLAAQAAKEEAYKNILTGTAKGVSAASSLYKPSEGSDLSERDEAWSTADFYDRGAT